ncbi:MAG TPA: pitrilysin family protein [Allosphingosinicella sp.]|jgi:predicted Zn-dependent peptidase
MRSRSFVSAALGIALAATAAAPAEAQRRATPAKAAPAQGLRIDSQYYTLPNGLKVVLSRDAAVPTATVGIYYGIGFRIEPRNRTGFAHLFEHLMFQGSANAPKGVFDKIIYNNGGVNNGSTRFDFTNYYEVVPSNALENVLWVEGDRMARLDVSQTVLDNQRGVVTNEVKGAVLNQPYGGWPWLHMPQLANENWHNAHNFYGDLGDLAAATVGDARDFYKAYYKPNNAVLVVAGDIDYARTRAWIDRYFGAIPRGTPVKLPDISEPRQTKEKFKRQPDPLIPRPAFGAAWHVPPRNSPEWYAMGLLDQILGQGQDSRLFQELVRKRGLTSGVQAGINIGLGHMYNYRGPMLWTVSFIHDPGRSREELTGAIDAVIEDVRTKPVSTQELERARTKIRSSLYNLADPATRFSLIDLLAVGAMWENDPKWVNGLEAGFNRVTPELLLATAKEYLRPTNRSIMMLEPAPRADKGATK